MSRLIVLFISLFSLQVQATTYYVSTSGSDSNNGTSTATPWADLSVSVGKLNAGDTLLLKRGDTFNETSVISVEDANVTIGCFGEGARPIVSGQSHQYPGGIYAAQLRFGTSTEGNNSGIGGKVECVEFRDSSGYGIQANSDNVTVNDVRVLRAALNGISSYYGSSGTNITNSYVEEANYGYAHKDDTGFYGDKYGALCTGCWGSSVSVRGNSHLVSGNTLIKNHGEAIISLDGSTNVTIKNNYIEGGKVGIYANGTGVLVDSNIMYKIDGYSYPLGIAINNEPISYQRALDRGLPVPAQDVVIVNNLIAGFKTCLWLADEIGQSDANYPSYGYTTYGKITFAHNTCIDNEKGVKLDGPPSLAQTIIRNNIFAEYTDAVAADMVYGTGNPTVLPTIDSNYFTVAPSGGAGATNTVTSGVTFDKTTGWRTATTGTITAADFLPTANVTGVATLGNGVTRTLDYYGNSISNPPNLGAIKQAGAPGGGGSTASISAVNGGVNMLTASAINTATGAGLKGAYGGLAKDSDSDQALSGVIGTADSGTLYFTAGDLSGINSAPYSLDIYYDTPALYPTSPRTWTPEFGGAVVISNAASNWIFDSGARIAANSGGGTGNVAQSATFAVTSGQTVNAECYYGAGTSGDMRITVKNGAGNLVRFGGLGVGNHNGQAALASTGGTSIQTFSESLVNTGIYKGSMQFVANYTGNHYLQFGPDTGTLGNDVILYECRPWVNRTQNTMNYVLDTPFTATLSDLNTDNVIDQISAANGSNLFALSGDIGGVSIPFLTPNVSGSVATFKSPDLSGLANGNQTLTLNVAQPVEIDQTPTSWPTNSGLVAVTSYTGTHLGYGGGAKLTVGAGGADWGGFKIDDLVTVAAGDVIEQWVDVVQSTGGQVRVSLTNQTAGGYVDYKGIFGALSSTAQTACSSSTLSETAQDRMIRIKILCTSAAAGAYRLSITTNSSVTGDAVIVLGRTTFVNATPIAKTLTVTNPGGIVPEPEPVKRLKLGTPSSKIKTLNAFGKMVDSNDTIDRVYVYGSDITATTGAVDPLVTLQNVVLTSGIGEASEANVVPGSGSLNALDDGTYWVLSVEGTGANMKISYGQKSVVTE